jgi:UDP-2-acetamido-2,6-beta-L-arabino-hexul-4-ose reductase
MAKIVGTGMIARVFQSAGVAPGVTIFASGVSNSAACDQAQFERETRLLKDALASSNGPLVYFSTTSIYDPASQHSPYVRHKLLMERLLVESGQTYVVLRLPQVVGLASNPATLTEYLYRSIMSGMPFEVWRHAHRHLLDVDDVKTIVAALVVDEASWAQTFDLLPPHPITPLEIVTTLEAITGRRGNYTIADKGSAYVIGDIRNPPAHSVSLVDFDRSYSKRVIEKYYKGRYD